MTSVRAVAGNFLVSGLGQAVGLLIGVVTIGVLTRHLGEGGYGAYTTAFVFLSVLTQVAGFGLGMAQLHLMARGDLDEGRVTGGVLGLRLLLGGVVLGAAPFAVRLLDYGAEVDQLVALGAAGFFFSFLSGSLNAVFQKHLAMARFAVAGLFYRVSFLAAAVACAALDLGPAPLMLALGAIHFATFLIQAGFARRLVSLRPRCELLIWREAITTGWPLALLTVLGLLCMQGDLLLLAHCRDEREVGIYGLPYRILFLVISTIPGLFMSLLLPQLSRTWHAGDRATFHRYLQTAFDFFGLALLPVLVGTLSRADDIVVFIGGPQFAASAGVLRVQILAAVALFYGMLYRLTGLAIEQQRRLLMPTLLVTALTVAAYAVFIPAHGMYGAAWTKVLHTIAGAAVTFAVMLPATGHSPRLTVLRKAVLASAAMAAELWLVPRIHVLVDLALGCAVYAALVLSSGAVTPRALRETLAAARAR